MPEILGQTVPKVKAIVSHDFGRGAGQAVLMADHIQNVPISDWETAFRDRIREIQGKRTQAKMAELLGIEREAYSKYVGGRKSKMPIWLLPRLANVGEMSVEELILGQQAKPVAKAKPEKKRKAG